MLRLAFEPAGDRRAFPTTYDEGPMIRWQSFVLTLLMVPFGACREPAPADIFWTHLRGLCGSSFRGRVVEAPPNDTTFTGRELVMHVRECGDSTIAIPLHVGGNRSRTWLVSRTAAGLRLKHDHRHEDGVPDSITQYGGDARTPGGSERMEFPADSFTVAMLPAARTNLWTLELTPGRRFVYALHRVGTDRRYRIEFDLSHTVANPPPPWGAR